ncbi:MAG: hypothetical protein P4L93_04715 [Coriobacteriia bacterium]|nr:hypothetical protein [Coriobacteriia bacterium]
MRTDAKSAASLLAVAVALLAVLGVVGCNPKAAAPVAPSAAAPGGVTPTASPSQPSAPATAPANVDAAGGAIGAPVSVGSASKSAQIGSIPRPSNKVAATKGVKALQDDGQIGKLKSVSVRAMTQDKKGRWWVLLAVTDDTAGTNQAVVSFDGKTWSDVAIGTTISTTDLPPDVRF